jgi:hypothetical protein
MFMDCPKCGTELIVNDIDVRRCSDCLQWIDLEADGPNYAKTYYGSSHQVLEYDRYDEDNYAYDY